MFKAALLITLLAGIQQSQSLSCVPCGSFPCQTPACCESGYYNVDECGCCLTCAKPEGAKCGGPFGISGVCGTGNSCLRSCGCNTVLDKECIFPFQYEGQTYSSCTTAKSDNGVPWCATEVDNSGVVIPNRWEDCAQGCTDFCDEGFLFNVNGRCINSTQAPSLLRTFKDGNVPAQLDEAGGAEQQSAPLCGAARSPADSPDFCRCSRGTVDKDLSGLTKGGCTKPQGGGFDDFEEGYCFLENVKDPSKPSSNCFSDADWSVADGRFYSHQACIVAAENKNKNDGFFFEK